jgi:hypothetical protein
MVYGTGAERTFYIWLYPQGLSRGRLQIFLFFLVENDNYLIFLCILFPYQIFCLGNTHGYPTESPAAVYSGGTQGVKSRYARLRLRKCDKNATPLLARTVIKMQHPSRSILWQICNTCLGWGCVFYATLLIRCNLAKIFLYNSNCCARGANRQPHRHI